MCTRRWNRARGRSWRQVKAQQRRALTSSCRWSIILSSTSQASEGNMVDVNCSRWMELDSGLSALCSSTSGVYTNTTASACVSIFTQNSSQIFPLIPKVTHDIRPCGSPPHMTCSISSPSFLFLPSPRLVHVSCCFWSLPLLVPGAV